MGETEPVAVLDDSVASTVDMPLVQQLVLTDLSATGMIHCCLNLNEDAENANLDSEEYFVLEEEYRRKTLRAVGD